MPLRNPDVLARWVGGGECPVQYDLDHEGWTYYARYRGGWCELYGAPGDTLALDESELLYQCQLSSSRYDGIWSDRETTVYLALLTDAIVDRAFSGLQLPSKDRVHEHELYRLGPLPLHPVGLRCGIAEPSPPFPVGLTPNRHAYRRRREAGIHDHDLDCVTYVTSSEINSWIRSHPQEHDAFVKVFPGMWESVKRSRAR